VDFEKGKKLVDFEKGKQVSENDGISGFYRMSLTGLK
jgi:hypothetical protein